MDAAAASMALTSEPSSDVSGSALAAESVGLSMRTSSKMCDTGGRGVSDRGPRRRRRGVGSGSGIQLISHMPPVVLVKDSIGALALHIVRMGELPPLNAPE